MRAVVQRVTRASVAVNDQITGEIGRGLMVLLGVEVGDGEKDLAYIADKVVNLRIFEDDAGKMNRSLLDVGGGILAVPGVDAALMGPADLSVSLGTMDIGHPKVTEYIQRVVEAAKRRGLPSGTHVGDLAMLKIWRASGMRLLMYSHDFGLMMNAGVSAIQELRS